METTRVLYLYNYANEHPIFSGELVCTAIPCR